MSATSDLEDLLARQHGIQQNLLNLERQIYEYEGSYLEDTQSLGNIFRGFDGFLSAQNPADKRAARKFKESERYFSLSSCTSAKANDVRPAPGSPVQGEERKVKKGGIYKKKGMSAGAKGARDGTSSKKMRARQKDTDEELEIS